MELVTEGMPLSLQQVNQLLFKPLGVKISNFIVSKESKEYDAASFTIGGKNSIFRQARVTPKKTGQFVTIWKRNENRKTVPYQITDNIHYLFIAVNDNNQFGLFIFPASVLAHKGILNQGGKEGKRGIRVYPPWDEATSKQALKTKTWQSNYFLLIDGDIQLFPANQLLRDLA